MKIPYKALKQSEGGKGGEIHNKTAEFPKLISVHDVQPCKVSRTIHKMINKRNQMCLVPECLVQFSLNNVYCKFLLGNLVAMTEVNWQLAASD